MALSQGQLEQLWIQAGGPRKYATVMARIAQRESSGQPGVQNLKYPDHSIGLWQINQLAHKGAYGSDQALKDPLTNAKAAVAIFNASKRAGQDPLKPWSTYNPATDIKLIGNEPSASARSGKRTVTQTVGAVDNTDARKALLGQFLAEGGADNAQATLNLAMGLKGTRSTPGRQVTTTLPGRGGGAVGKPPKGQLLELFWRGPGAINVDNGQRVGSNFVSGHTDHVHVAAGPKEVIRLGRLAQKMGLTVRENPAFDPVDPVHTEGSFHYSNRAIDVSGDASKMSRFAHRVARLYGV